MAKINSMKGFSLMEILAVLAIISILASFALPAYNRSIERGYGEDVKARITAMLFSQEQYFVENREYADTLAEIGESAQMVEDGQVKYTFSLQGCSNGDTTDYSDCVRINATAGDTQKSYGSLTATSLGERRFTSGDNSGHDW